jgi:chromosome segregation ATPase
VTAEGLDADVQKFLENLDVKFDGLKKAVTDIDRKADLQGQTLTAQDKHLERIEVHLSQINGGCKQHSAELAAHDKRVSLLENRILITAEDVEAHRAKAAEDLEARRVATAEDLVTERAAEKRKPVDLREDWWKFLMVLAALAAGLGPQIIDKL